MLPGLYREGGEETDIFLFFDGLVVVVLPSVVEVRLNVLLQLLWDNLISVFSPDDTQELVKGIALVQVGVVVLELL